MSISLFFIIAFSAMLPVVGIRATIPFFIATNPDVPVWFIIIATVLGDLGPVFVLLFLLPKITNWLHDKAAPKINQTIMTLHNYFVKGERLHYLLFGIFSAIIISWFILILIKITNIIYFAASLTVVLLISYALFRVSKKTYHAANEGSSIIHWFYKTVHQEHSAKFYRWGSLALMIIVAIPVPVGGAWSASVLAFLFNIPFWRSVLMILLGAIISSLTVSAIALGVFTGIGII